MGSSSDVHQLVKVLVKRITRVALNAGLLRFVEERGELDCTLLILPQADLTEGNQKHSKHH